MKKSSARRIYRMNSAGPNIMLPAERKVGLSKIR